MRRAAGHGRMTFALALAANGLALAALLGVAAGQGASRMGQIEQDIALMVQGSFTPDAIGPDRHREVLGRVRAHPAQYLAAFEGLYGSPPIAPDVHSNLYLAVPLRVLAESDRPRVQAVVQRLLKQYDAVLLAYDEARDKAAALALLPEETARMIQRLNARRGELRSLL